MWRLVCLLSVLGAVTARADAIVATRTIRAHEIIAATDLAARPIDAPGAFRDPDAVIGQEARVMLYAGRPITPNDVGPPATVERNAIVTLVFRSGGLRISTEGRALGRGAPGDRIRVINMTSKATVSGRIREDGTIEVDP